MEPGSELVTPVVVAPVEHTHSQVTCEGCGCVLDSRGRIIRRGEGIETYLKAQDTIRDLRRDLAAAESKITDLQSEVTRLSPSIGERSRFPWET